MINLISGMIVSPLVRSEVRGRTLVVGSSEHVRTKWEDVQYGNQALPSELKESILLTVHQELQSPGRVVSTSWWSTVTGQ